MKTLIICKSTVKGIHSFYLLSGKEKYFLFNQTYRKGVDEYFSKGVLFNDAINYSKAHNDSAIKRTMGKIPMYVRYLEKEYGLMVLNKTKKKFSQSYYRVRCA